MRDERAILDRLTQAERHVRYLIVANVVIVVGLATVTIGNGTRGADILLATQQRSQDVQDVITARGLVIVDADGRERLVLGAPMADASDDVRLAATSGVTVLDEESRIAASLGINNPLIRPDGTTGPRRGTAHGMTFYDPRTGQERGGMGAFNDGRANLCIDWAGAEREAVCVAVWSDDQYAAVILNGTPHETSIYDRVVLYVGSDGTGRIKAFGGNDTRDGVSIDVGRGSPEVTVFDSAQSPIGDLVDLLGN